MRITNKRFKTKCWLCKYENVIPIHNPCTNCVNDDKYTPNEKCLLNENKIRLYREERLVTIEHKIGGCLECTNRQIFFSKGVYKMAKLTCGITGTVVGDQYTIGIHDDCPLEISK